MATIKDVSRATGLSISTISKYINGGNVRRENRARIDEAIASLHFKANPAARALKTSRSMKVGVLLPSLNVPFFAGIVADIEARVMREGYNTILCTYNNDPALELLKLGFLIDEQVDGIILVAERVTAAQLNAVREIADHSMPLVLLDRLIAGFACDYVYTESVGVCRFAVEQFLRAGHQKIGLITGPPVISTAYDRMLGYREAMEAHGARIRDEWIKWGEDYSLNAGYYLFNELMDMDDPPTALLVTNHELTIGAVTAAHERGMRIPGDVAFIGYDDPQLLQLLNPPVSIVKQPTDRIATETATLLLRRMRGDNADYPKTVALKACLMMQES